jgi:hypothetical protein
VLKQTPKHPCMLWVECEQGVQAARRGTERARIDKPMELWSSLLNHHLHQRHQNSFADLAGCSSYGARHATCKEEAPLTWARTHELES